MHVCRRDGGGAVPGKVGRLTAAQNGQGFSDRSGSVVGGGGSVYPLLL